MHRNTLKYYLFTVPKCARIFFLKKKKKKNLGRFSCIALKALSYTSVPTS